MRIIFLLLFLPLTLFAKEQIKALYIPLADHYAALVAYERYASKMKHADFLIEQMANWDLLKAKFQSQTVDMAFVMSPLAMYMYNEKRHFKWVGLMHRDGNALAVNDVILQRVDLEKERQHRKPTATVAQAIVYEKNKHHKAEYNKQIHIALPHLLSTHAVVLYKYLKEHNVTIGWSANEATDVLGLAVAPPMAPTYIKGRANKNVAAAFEQSLPWADIVESNGHGRVAWYSKDVLASKNGHVECIMLATQKSINTKRKALQEVIYYLHKAGHDIEKARKKGGKSLERIVAIIQKHIPLHTKQAIIASLDPHLEVINYNNLNIDKKGLAQVMNLALEGGILKEGVDIDTFADESFFVEIKE